MDVEPQLNLVFFRLLLKLPPELLSLVLLLATKQDILDYLRAARRRRTLCLVCKTWAESLYATPRAWRTFKMVFGSKTPVETAYVYLRPNIYHFWRFCNE